MSVPPLRHWFLGLTLSLAGAWAAGALFLDTVQPVVFDPQVRRWVAQPDTVFRSRSEGWASSRAGVHGIRGLPGGKLPEGPKVVFWGDSFVEAMQVDDAVRMAQTFTRLAADSGLQDSGQGLCGVGIGTGGDSLIDSLFKLPDYAPVLGPVTLHVFFLGKISDVLPDIPRDCRAIFRSAPELALVPAPGCPPNDLAQRLAPAFRELELAGAYEIYRKLQALDLRLRPGPVLNPSPVAAASGSGPPASPEGAWTFLLAELVQRAKGPVLLVYAPTLPRLERGQARQDDAEVGTALAFARTCQRLGVPFVDLGPAFAEHFRATGRLPRGFSHSPPGTGHLNADGHRMAAAAVVAHLKEQAHALLAR